MTTISDVFTVVGFMEKNIISPGAGQKPLVFVKLPVICMPSGLSTAMLYHVSSR
jgi:hypothetical protein